MESLEMYKRYTADSHTNSVRSKIKMIIDTARKRANEGKDSVKFSGENNPFIKEVFDIVEKAYKEFMTINKITNKQHTLEIIWYESKSKESKD